MAFSYQIEDDGDSRLVYLFGSIDEDAETPLRELLGHLSPRMRINFKGIDTINSFGVRTWIQFLRDAEKGRDIIFEECTPEVIAQVNMIPSFRGKAIIKSVFAHYLCDNCANQDLILFEDGKNFPKSSAFELEEVTCKKCSHLMEMEELEEEFFSWLNLH